MYADEDDLSDKDEALQNGHDDVENGDPPMPEMSERDKLKAEMAALTKKKEDPKPAAKVEWKTPSYHGFMTPN